MHYSMFIQWSEEDRAYVVSLPEWGDRVFSNPVTHVDTYEEAVRNGREAIEALVGWASEQGRPLPEPRVFAPVP
jgi:predicted RNase H-like HicB family nuclease